MWAETQQDQKDKPKISINFESFVGQFGPLKIFIHESKLQMDVREPSLHHPIIIDNNTLLDGDVIIKVKRDKDSNPVSLTCYFANNFPPFIAKSLSDTARASVLLKIPPEKLASSTEGVSNQVTNESVQSSSISIITPTSEATTQKKLNS